ncbi:MAG: MotE family protein [Paracoccaceae bacterium]
MTARLRSGRSALAIISILFLSSAALRFGSGVGEALASEADMPEEELATPMQCTEPPAVLAAALSAREAAVAAGELVLKDRVAAVSLAEAAIAKRLEELQAAEAALAGTLAIADQAAEQDLTRLTTVYETMKPKDAAALFETMAPEFAAGFLGRMQPQAAAAVMSGLNPETAYQISLVLAGRNAEAPTE